MDLITRKEIKHSFIDNREAKQRYARAIWPIPETRKTPDEKEIVSFMDIGVGQALAELAFTIHKAQEEARYYHQEWRKSREEVREEFRDEIEDLQRAIDRSPTPFTEVEGSSYCTFLDKHRECRKSANKGAYDVTIHIHGTGLGDVYTVECPICHETEDITDIGAW